MATSLSKYRDADLIAEYWRENGRYCEVWPHLPDDDRSDVRRMRKTNLNKGLELHHILGGNHYKVDNWSNVIIIDYVVHQPWGHHHNHKALTVACLYAKYRKAEFDVHELNQACQKPTIRNEIQYLKIKLSHKPEYVAMCDEMLNTLPEE